MHDYAPILGESVANTARTIPQSLRDSSLYTREAKNLIFTLRFLFNSARVVTLATPSALTRHFP